MIASDRRSPGRELEYRIPRFIALSHQFPEVSGVFPETSGRTKHLLEHWGLRV